MQTVGNSLGAPVAPITETAVVRRASYGPMSPSVGRRGIRTRDRIVSASLELFDSKGFNATTVGQISTLAGISRPTLYQYFESKEQIFSELLDELSDALMRVLQAAGPLGPTAAGLRNLTHWLREWTQVCDSYGAVFVMWAGVGATGAGGPVSAPTFLSTYTARIAGRFRDSKLIGLDAREAAIVTTCVVHRFNFLLFTRGPGRPEGAGIDDIAAMLQIVLFPATPQPAMGAAQFPHHAGRAPSAQSDASLDTGSRRRTPIDGRSTQSAVTMARFEQAAAVCFAEKGYYRTNVEDISSRAGLARGTYYRYFEDKLDLLLALSDTCERRLDELHIAFDRIPPGPAGSGERRHWLRSYLAFRAVYIGVMRAWIDREPTHPSLEQTRERVASLVRDSVEAILDTSPAAGSLSSRAVEVLLMGVLERLPDVIPAAAIDDDASDLVELMATVIERGLYRSEAEPV